MAECSPVTAASLEAVSSRMRRQASPAGSEVSLIVDLNADSTGLGGGSLRASRWSANHFGVRSGSVPSGLHVVNRSSRNFYPASG